MSINNKNNITSINPVYILKDDNTNFTFIEDYSNNTYYAFNQIFLFSYFLRPIPNKKDNKENIDRIHSLSTNHNIDTATIPKLATKIVNSKLLEETGEDETLIITCPEIITEQVFNMMEYNYHTINEYNKKTGNDKNLSVKSALKSRPLYINNSYHNALNHSKIQRWSYNKRTRKIEKSIIEPFPSHSKNNIGKLFIRHLKNIGINKAMSELAIFILINEMITRCLKEKWDTSLLDIFPTIRNNNKIYDNNVNHGHQVYFEHTEFMHTVKTRFNNINFTLNDFTHKLAELFFADHIVYENGVLNDFSIEGVFLSRKIMSMSHLYATDYMKLCSTIDYDSTTSSIRYNDNKTMNLINDEVSSRINKITKKFYNNPDYYASMPLRLIQTNKVNFNDSEIHNERLSLIEFNLFYRDYNLRISKTYGSQMSNNLNRLLEKIIIPIVYNNAMTFNHNKDYLTSIHPKTIIYTSFIITMIQFFQENGELDKLTLTNNTIYNFSLNIFNENDFFENLSLLDVVKIAHAFAENDSKIPLNLIKTIIVQ